MISEVLFDDGRRRWVFFGRDPGKPGEVIDTNEYLVTDGGKGILLDPGGIEVFPAVVAAVSRAVDLNDIDSLFGSHQDPDIISSLALWVGLVPHVKVHVPAIWTSFIKHFALGADIAGIPDEGATLHLGASRDLTFVPAHYLHSSANFSVYDPTARILFTGDIGAALLPPDEQMVTVKDFDHHIQFMEGFHRRWMPSNRAKQAWLDRVGGLRIDMLCPQHGACFAGADVERFLNWFGELEVGAAV